MTISKSTASSQEARETFIPASPRSGDGRAFTLMEILCVAALIAILAALVMGGMGGAREKAAKMKLDQERYEQKIHNVQNSD